MLCSFFTRGVSAGALMLAFSSETALAQQSLPTIDVGGARRAAAAHSPAQRDQVAPVGQPSTIAPLDTSRLRLEPKTPTEGYIVRNADSTTKTDIPIREIPASIQVVPNQVLRDQQATTIQDALSNVSDVVSNTIEGTGTIFYIRGFKTNFIYRNALALPQRDGSPLSFDTANIERIEVMKGPSSILFGRAEPGGIINIVTKQPLDEPLYRVDQQVGSYNHYRTQWDLSSPVKEIPGLAYRVSGAYQTSGSFRQFQGGRRALLAPVVRYSPTPWTELTIDSQLSTLRWQNDLGLPTASKFWNVPFLPYSRSFQEANDPKDINDAYSIGYNFRQNLTEDWKVTNRFLYTQSRWSSNQLAGAGVDPDLATSNRFTQFQDLKGRNFATNIDLNGKFQALGGKHNFLFGLDYLNNYYDYVYTNGSTNYPINLYAPLYGTVPDFAFFDSVIGSGFKFHSSVLNRQKGMYVQDYVTWFDKLHLMIGARYDVADVTQGQAFSNYDFFPEGVYWPSKSIAIAERLRQPTAIFRGWSPRVGLVYDILPQLSAYASYSRSFGRANNGFDSAGNPFPPEKGLQWEVGLKAQPLPGLLATLSFFQITKSNVTTAAFGSVQTSRLAGLQRSRGIELDVIGAVTDRISVVANYAYLDAKVINDTSPINPLNPYGSLNRAAFGPTGGFLGNHLEFAPRHSGKIFLTYDFGENGLGFRAGGGVTVSSNWWGDLQNRFIMPGFARLDGFANYTAELYGHRVTAQLNLQNINNVRYFEAVDNTVNFFAPPFYRIPAQPFRAVGTLSFKL